MKAFRLLLIVVLLLPIRALHAELDDQVLMTVNIPFAFTVQNTRMPAGHYVIYSVSFDHLWRLSSFRTDGIAFFGVTTDYPATRRFGPSKLVFYRYESDYVLHTIEESSRSAEATVLATKQQQQLERNHSQPQMALVYAQSNGVESGHLPK